MEIYLVEVSGTAVRSFETEARAKQYIECLESEWDDELEEPRYFGHDLSIVPIWFEK